MCMVLEVVLKVLLCEGSSRVMCMGVGVVGGGGIVGVLMVVDFIFGEVFGGRVSGVGLVVLGVVVWVSRGILLVVVVLVGIIYGVSMFVSRVVCVVIFF